MYDSVGLAETPSRFTFRDCGHVDESFSDALLAGLLQRDKAIPCRFLYDLEGSHLFDTICEQPEYYPTRTETAILHVNAIEIARLAGPDVSLIELGSGSSIKTRILLDALQRPAQYVPIDISAEHLKTSAAAVAEAYPSLDVTAVCANYGAPFDLPYLHGRPIGFFPGSTIGNLSTDEATALLVAWRERLAPDGLLIVGIDLRKSPSVLEAAYDDSAGVTAQFIRNILARANRELDTTFELDRFAYDVAWTDRHGRVEMHLQSSCEQTVRVGSHMISFASGERIHVENSQKYTVAQFSALARDAGFEPAACFLDPVALFSVHVLRGAKCSLADLQPTGATDEET